MRHKMDNSLAYCVVLIPVLVLKLRMFSTGAWECHLLLTYFSYIFPFLVYRGVHLKDLVCLHTALPDRMDGGLVNFRKMAQLSIIFTELMQVMNSTLPIEPNMDLVNTIKVNEICVAFCFKITLRFFFCFQSLNL